MLRRRPSPKPSVERSFASRSVPHFIISVAFLGLLTYLLKGDDPRISLWGGLAMALVYGILVITLEGILRRRR